MKETTESYWGPQHPENIGCPIRKSMFSIEMDDEQLETLKRTRIILNSRLEDPAPHVNWKKQKEKDYILAIIREINEKIFKYSREREKLLEVRLRESINNYGFTGQ